MVFYHFHFSSHYLIKFSDRFIKFYTFIAQKIVTMQFNKLILSTFFLMIGFSSIAQVAIDPTGKRFMKPKERTKFGGPTKNTHPIPPGPDNINITFIEIQIDPVEKGGIEVTARGTKTSNLRGCDNCNIAGRIIINGDAVKEIANTSNDLPTKIKQDKNSGASRRVAFKNEDNIEYAVVTNKDGGFLMSTIPNGVYTIWVGGKKVISDYILKSIELSPEDLKKEQDLKKEMELRRQQEANKTPETPVEHKD
jgi:hypothetical protein